MNLAPSRLGGSRKQFTLLGVLAALIGVSYWINHSSDSPSAASVPTTPAPAAIPEPGTIPSRPANAAVNTPVPIQRTSAGASRGVPRATEDFKPSLKPKDGVDVTSIDPTLRLAMLEKLRNLPMEGGARSVFKEGDPPPPPAPKPVPIPVGPILTAAKEKAEEEKPKGPPPPPPPAPIPLKFYGYANQQHTGGPKKAFFLDGEDIRIAGENDIIRNRYKIVKIGVNSAVVEDTTDKHQQTLQLEPELG